MLFAHCHARNDQRTFKIDRILSAVPMDRAALEAVMHSAAATVEESQVPVVENDSQLAPETDAIDTDGIDIEPRVQDQPAPQGSVESPKQVFDPTIAPLFAV
jgi:predicted DNA-binding transcriptional regulator YafY